MADLRRVLVLGSTGSIGTQTLDIARANPERFMIVGLSAGRNQGLLAEQAAEFDLPQRATALGVQDAERLIREVPADVIVNGITGSVGLGPTLAALETGATLALANKESLIVGAPLVRQLARPGQIVPVDSEHSAIAQCLSGGTRGEVSRLILTASGGPFRGKSRAELDAVTPADALAHPTWNMGRVVTTNSATLVNKGLEMIEANVLFDVPFDRIDVVIHPTSMVHSMVEFTDGATIAQVSTPDMRLPIALALDWPKRVPGAVTPIPWGDPDFAQTWSFSAPDHENFPALRLARRVGEAGGAHPAVFNAANEVAVDAFHDGALPFLGIVDTVSEVVDAFRPDGAPVTRESLAHAENWARETARQRILARG